MRFIARQTQFAALLGIVLLRTESRHQLIFGRPNRSKLQWNRERKVRNQHLLSLGIMQYAPGKLYPLSLVDTDDRITEAPILASHHHPSQARIPGRTFDAIAYIPAATQEEAESARDDLANFYAPLRGIHVFPLKTIDLNADMNIDGRHVWKTVPARDRRQEKELITCL